MQHAHQHKTLHESVKDFPCLDHRFALSDGTFHTLDTSDVIRDMGQNGIAILKIIQHYCSGRSDLEAPYYGLHSVRLILDDINAVLDHFYETWESNNPNHLTELEPVKKVIQPALGRALSITVLLSGLFVDDDNEPPRYEITANAIDAIIREIEEIIETMNDFNQLKKRTK